MKRKVIGYLLTVSMCMSMIGCGNKAAIENVQTDEIVEADENTAEKAATETADENDEIAKTQEASDENEEVKMQEISEESEETEVTEQNKEAYDVPEGFDSVKDGVVYGEVIEITYDSKTTGTTRKANVILPPNYSAEKKYPVLYLLHGIGGDHNEWKGGAPVNIVSNLIADGQASEMIVVMPNVRAREKDAGNPQDIYSLEHYKAFDNFINDLRDDLMPYMEANYPIATGKENTAIAGLSMGGRESLYIGFSMPETFGYIGAFCPAPGLLAYSNFGVSEDGLFTKEAFTLPSESDNFVMIVAGASDNIVSTWPEIYHKTLDENGVENTFYITAGGHDFGVWKHGLYNFVKCIFR